jgi:hypothetical protein
MENTFLEKATKLYKYFIYNGAERISEDYRYHGLNSGSQRVQNQ